MIKELFCFLLLYVGSYTIGQGFKWGFILVYFLFMSYLELIEKKGKKWQIWRFSKIFLISYILHIKILLTEGIISTKVIPLVQLRHKPFEYSRLF